jgi:hypothetical protein
MYYKEMEMIQAMRQLLFGLIVLSSAAFATAPSWIDPGNLEVYWFDDDGTTEFERGTDIRTTIDLSGSALSTEERLERVTKTWLPIYNYYLNTINGMWQTGNGSYDYTISTTDNPNDTLHIPDGEMKLINVVNIEGQTQKVSSCFDLDVTFSMGAKRYDIAYKDGENYELWWIPENWLDPAHPPYSSLNDFMDADIPFLWNSRSNENAGFRVNAALSDGSGDLVILTYDTNTNSFIEGRPIGDWNSTYKLPGQSTASIKLHITDPEFLGDDDADFLFATLHNDTAVVWIGGHRPAETNWETFEAGGIGFIIGNQVAYNDYMNAIAPYDFSKLVNCDLIDKKLDYTVGSDHLETYYYGDMNFISHIEVSPGLWYPFAAGTWSVEDGVLISDIVQNDINKTVTADEIDLQSMSINHTLTGRAKLVSMQGQLNAETDLSTTDIPYRISVDSLKGMKINLTYTEDGESMTDDVFLFPNMTYAFGNSGDDVGVWKVENGVLMLDSYWIGDDGITVETGIESWVFTDATHATVYVEHQADANIIIHSTVAIQSSDNYPPEFTADPLTNPFTVDSLKGKLIVVGDPGNSADQDKLYFYANMSYKQETHDENGDPETITGAWSVEEGAAIMDVVYSDTESAQYVITDNGDDTARFMEVLGGGTETDPAVQKISISDIPSEEGNSGVLPAVIMYLLN